MIADTTEALSHLWGPALAFAAGLVSLASPCVLPLVPGYLSFVTAGAAVERRDRLADRLSPILLFVAGFTILCPLYGGFASTFVQIFKGRTGQIVAGIVIIVLGLLLVAYAVGRGPIALFAERRALLDKARPGPNATPPLEITVDG